MEGSDRQWTLQQLHSVDKEGETAVGILDHIAVWAHLTQEKKPRASNRYWKATVSWQRPPLPVRQSQTGGACPGQISGPRRLQRVQNAALTLTLTLALALTLIGWSRRPRTISSCEGPCPGGRGVPKSAPSPTARRCSSGCGWKWKSRATNSVSLGPLPARRRSQSAGTSSTASSHGATALGQALSRPLVVPRLVPRRAARAAWSRAPWRGALRMPKRGAPSCWPGGGRNFSNPKSAAAAH